MKNTQVQKLIVVACSLLYITSVVQLEASAELQGRQPRYRAHARRPRASSLERQLQEAQQLNTILTTSLKSGGQRFRELQSSRHIRHQNYVTERSRANEAEKLLERLAETCVLLNKENADLHARVTELSRQLLLPHGLPVPMPLEEPTKQRDQQP